MRGYPRRDRLIRYAYVALLAVVCLAGAYYLAVYAPGIRENASPVPMGKQVVPHNDEGETVYITPRQQLTLNLYGAAFGLALCAWLFVGIALELRYKIEIFGPLPWSLAARKKEVPRTPFSSNKKSR